MTSLAADDPVVVTAVFRFRPEHREQVLQALGTAIAAVHEEPGCTLYAIHDAPDGSIVMIEKWDTVRDLDVHGDAPAVGELNKALEGLLLSPVEVTRLVPLPYGEDSKGTL